MALDTHRDEDFNRVSLIDRILNEKLPFFTDKWSTLRTKKGWKRPTFIDFLEFLKFQHRVTEYTEGTGHAAQKAAPQKPAVQAKVHALAVNPASPPKPVSPRGPQLSAAAKVSPKGPDSGTWAQKAKAPRPEPATSAPKPTPEVRKPTCPMCQGAHWLQHCSRFATLEPDERGSYVRETKKCPNCLKGGHTAAKCYSPSNCWCREKHHALIHDAPLASGTAGTVAGPAPDTPSEVA